MTSNRGNLAVKKNSWCGELLLPTLLERWQWQLGVKEISWLSTMLVSQLDDCTGLEWIITWHTWISYSKKLKKSVPLISEVTTLRRHMDSMHRVRNWAQIVTMWLVIDVTPRRSLMSNGRKRIILRPCFLVIQNDENKMLRAWRSHSNGLTCICVSGMLLFHIQMPVSARQL